MSTLLTVFVAALTLTSNGQTPAAQKPYSEVITKEAKSQDGLFKVHEIGEKYFFEIPASALNKDMLWQAQQVTIPSTLGSPGVQDNRLVRWQRRGKQVFLMGVDYTLRSLDPTGIERAIPLINPPAIIESFPVQTEGPNGEAVIDVTDLLLADHPQFHVGSSWNATVQRNRSYVHKVKAFPTNIEMQSLLTFRVTPGEIIPGTDSGYAGSVGPYASLMMHYSFLLLPEVPMKPRYRDPRVGFFGILVQEFGGPEHRAVNREMIRRFRLEKKDPTAALSEPVKPIVFYLSQDMPKKWRPYAKRAVEAWQPAFEQAGFKNAILAREAPTKEEDPDFDSEDARYSMIRWTPSSIENAFGLTITDPRSGEIISGQVVFYHSFLSWLQNTYFAQVAGLDPNSHRLPFADDLMGRLLQFILTHEVGHSIGLEHNMKASAPYTVAQLRDPAFVRNNDIASSIMDYARFNFVAQPGDGVPLDRGIGAYDKFAIEWGYKPAPAGSDEGAMLRSIADRQNGNPFLRFGNYRHFEDPSVIGEDLGGDPITSARLGFQNLKRSAKLLVPAAVRPGKDYDQLSQTYAYLVRQHSQLLDNVIRLVGGVYADDHLMVAGKPMYTPVSAEKQRAAVKFMCGPEGVPPAELLAPEISSRLFASGDMNRVMNFQYVIVFSLFDDRRVRRLLDQEAQLGAKAYSVRELVNDVQEAVWRQLDSPKPSIDVAQRQYQRGYLVTLDSRLNGSTASRTDLQAYARAALQALSGKISKSIPKAADEPTRLHLIESRRTIATILNGTSLAAKVTPPAAAPTRFSGARSGAHEACFPRSELEEAARRLGLG